MTVLKILEERELGHYSISFHWVFITSASIPAFPVKCSCYPGLNVLESGSAALYGTTPLIVMIAQKQGFLWQATG